MNEKKKKKKKNPECCTAVHHVHLWQEVGTCRLGEIPLGLSQTAGTYKPLWLEWRGPSQHLNPTLLPQGGERVWESAWACVRVCVCVCVWVGGGPRVGGLGTIEGVSHPWGQKLTTSCLIHNNPKIPSFQSVPVDFPLWPISTDR